MKSNFYKIAKLETCNKHGKHRIPKQITAYNPSGWGSEIWEDHGRDGMKTIMGHSGLVPDKMIIVAVGSEHRLQVSNIQNLYYINLFKIK
jgi:hypothetical protein